ncbi:MAG: YdcH family protein [Candidatus Sedimenticola sp. PURPLELP]
MTLDYTGTTEEIREQLHQLRDEHRDLDDAIARLSEGPYINELQLSRMKKRKLVLKDSISKLENILIPDLNA